jgi:hypothetical protein
MMFLESIQIKIADRKHTKIFGEKISTIVDWNRLPQTEVLSDLVESFRVDITSSKESSFDIFSMFPSN